MVTNDDDDFHRFDVELSDRETYFIGRIIAQWGALEHEVFMQTIKTFDTPNQEEIILPPEMNNMRFSAVLELWKSRVVDIAKDERANILKQQYDKIIHLYNFRNALVHGMWDWSAADTAKISTVRIRKESIIRVHFSADDLGSFLDQVSIINFKIRYPGGIEDLAREREEQGFYLSRLGQSLFTGTPLAEEWLASMQTKKAKD